MQLHCFMHYSTSSFRMPITFSTPALPPTASPHKADLPTNTQSAPKAQAFTISLPLLIPPSNQISTPYPRTASTTSSKQRMLLFVVSNYRAPWLLTKIMSAPFWTARMASSLQETPFAATFKPEYSLTYLIISQPIS